MVFDRGAGTSLRSSLNAFATNWLPVSCPTDNEDSSIRASNANAACSNSTCVLHTLG